MLEIGFYPIGRAIEENKFNPSGALLRAVLINSARSIAGGRHGNLEIPSG